MRLDVLYVRKTESKGRAYTYPRPSQYLLTHAHSYSTLAVAAMYSNLVPRRRDPFGQRRGPLGTRLPRTAVSPLLGLISMA